MSVPLIKKDESISVNEKLEELLEVALKAGATEARLMDVKDVVVDERVQFKCFIPRCNAYGNCLTCPPHTPSVDAFRKVLSNYQKAVIVQLETDRNSLDKSESQTLADLNLVNGIYKELLPYKFKLHDVIEAVERAAFKLGFVFAAGLGAGRCNLCGDQCPGILDGQCRHPFRARPAVEAMGIDIVQTLGNAGLSVEFSSAAVAKTNGLVLVC